MDKDRRALTELLRTGKAAGSEKVRALRSLIDRFGVDEILPEVTRAAIRDWEFATEALFVLRGRKDHAVLELALAIFAESKSSIARGGAVSTLARFQDRRAVDAMLDAARTGSRNLRHSALADIRRLVGEPHFAGHHAAIAEVAAGALDVGMLRDYALLILRDLPPETADPVLGRARPLLEKLAKKSPTHQKQMAGALLARLDA